MFTNLRQRLVKIQKRQTLVKMQKQQRLVFKHYRNYNDKHLREKINLILKGNNL